MMAREHVARPNSPHPARPAFTLVEVLAALTLGTVVLLSLHATSRLLVRQTCVVDAETRWMFAAEQTLSAIHDAMRSGSWPDVNDPVGGAPIQVTEDTITIRSGASLRSRARPAEMCFRRVGDSLVLLRTHADSPDALASETVLGDVSRLSVQREPRGVRVRLESMRGSIAERSCPVHAEAVRAP